VRPRRALCGAAVALLLRAAPAFAEEGDACVTSYEQAQQLRREGKPVRARAEIRLCLGSCPTLLLRDCERWLKEVDPEIARVALEVRDAGGNLLTGARVIVDGAAVPAGSTALELDPGRHLVQAEAPGRLAAEREIDARPGEPLSVELRLAALPQPEPPRLSPQPVPGSEEARGAPLASFVLGGFGLLSLATAAGLGVAGQVKKAQLLDEGCAPYCSTEEVETIRSLWETGAVLAGVGATALGVGVSLFLLQRKADRPSLRPVAVVAPEARAGWLGVTAAF
jgi:hypothetical protein